MFNEKFITIDDSIRFRPDGVDAYSGTWTVRIDGLKTKSGAVVKDFAYSVNFFNVGEVSGNVGADGINPSDSQPGGDNVLTAGVKVDVEKIGHVVGQYM